jgi:hypothetical protein
MDSWARFKNNDKKNKDKNWHENQRKLTQWGVTLRIIIKKINETERNYNEKNLDILKKIRYVNKKENQLKKRE